MLGSQDFCGYYDWTFAFVEQCLGHAAVERLWADAIGGESQDHYLQAAFADGLAGLYRTWQKTGEDEQCLWTWKLDEPRNLLRWDMRQCPSKGFLLANDLNTYSDYCDHCIGWMEPLLAKAGVQIARHEHNHAGQCWGEMALAGKPHESVDVADDIRNTPAWRNGYVDRWAGAKKLPLFESVCQSSDPCEVLQRWFAGRAISIVSARDYVERSADAVEPRGVLIDSPPSRLESVAWRFYATAPEARPLLMYGYFPSEPPVDFMTFGLPRPVPVLPLLLQAEAYRHHPHRPYPPIERVIEMITDALRKRIADGAVTV